MAENYKNKIQEVKQRFGIVGISPLLNRALETAIKVAPTDISVLILGESGVGKENISKIIHTLSRRKHNGFIAINCGAIPEGTIDSELFGHEKGSFTSAIDTRKGYFETVDGGTIFLDEIGELPLETQSRLLRVLESGEFLKVGSSKTQKTDVRVIAATNKDLYDLAQKGKFRDDLYYRLNTVTIKIPALRERRDDIPLLIAKFANDFGDKYRIPPVELSDDAVAVVQEFPWPGNIRQLRNYIEQLSILEPDRLLDAEKVTRYLPDLPSQQLQLTSESGQRHFEGNQERELMYKVLFDMRRDVAEMKNLLYQALVESPIVNPPQQQAVYSPSRLLGPAAPAVTVVPQGSGFTNGESNGFHPHEEENAAGESLSLHDTERDLIRKALQKHQGRRRLAARELGISERTLYRKIKEYELEE